jgi:hypothetical protein
MNHTILMGMGSGGGKPPPVVLPREDIPFIPSLLVRIREKQGW